VGKHFMFLDYNIKNLESNNYVHLDNFKNLLMIFNDYYIFFFSHSKINVIYTIS
jgi:hypothetical protein